NDARVEAATQIGADWDVRSEMKRHRFRHQVLDGGFEIAGSVMEVGLVVVLPVASDGDAAAVDGQQVPRWELPHAFEHGLAAETELEAEVVLQAIDIGLDGGQERDERLDLAREVEDAIDLRVI